LSRVTAVINRYTFSDIYLAHQWISLKRGCFVRVIEQFKKFKKKKEMLSVIEEDKEE